MDLETALDRLFAEPLEQFTATRNALASELSPTDPDGAREIKSLRKPNLAAWALNQLARRHPDVVGVLGEATENLRRAQRRVLSGGKAATLREATAERGRVVKRLTNLAAGILTEAGHAAAPSTLTLVSDSLVATAADAEGAELLRKGRLTRELRAESVVDVGGLTLISTQPSVDETSEAEAEADDRTSAVREAREAVAEARKDLDNARKQARDAEAEARKLAREAEATERRARSAHESAEFARRGAEARRADAEAAEQKLGEAQRALREAEGS